MDDDGRVIAERLADLGAWEMIRFAMEETDESVCTVALRPTGDGVEYAVFRGRDGDAHVLRRVERELADPARVSYRPYRGDFLDVFAEMRVCQAFVGMRFHSCLLAHLAGVPCLMLAYHPKSESLAARLHLHPDAVAALPVLQDSRALEARLDALLADRAKFRPAAALDALITEAARNFDLLSACLTGGRARARERHRRIG